MLIDTLVPSELLRHSLHPQRYNVFTLTSSLPYPKMALSIPSPDQVDKCFPKIDTFLKKPANYSPLTMNWLKEK